MECGSFLKQGSKLSQVKTFVTCFSNRICMYLYPGCTNHPAPGERFCSFHVHHKSPALSPNQISKESLVSLNSQQSNREKFLMSGLERDNIFVVEGILEYTSSHRLQYPNWGQKWPMGYGKGSTLSFFGAPLNFC